MENFGGVKFDNKVLEQEDMLAGIIQYLLFRKIVDFTFFFCSPSGCKLRFYPSFEHTVPRIPHS